MSKKMLKRSLALGALMAFVITGSAWAADNVLNGDMYTSVERVEWDGSAIVNNQLGGNDLGEKSGAERSYGFAVTTGSYTVDKVLNVTNSVSGTERNYGIAIKNSAILTVDGTVVVNVSGDSNEVRGIRNHGNGNQLTFNDNVNIDATLNEGGYLTGIDTWYGTTTFNGDTYISAEGTECSDFVNAVQIGSDAKIYFQGANTTLNAIHNGYTAQAISVARNNAEIYFDSSTVEINATSNYGATGIGGAIDYDTKNSKIKFDGKDAVIDINVLVDIDGDGKGDTGNSNAVGIMGVNFEVTDKVKEFNIEVMGSGISVGADGTAGINVTNRTVDINAGQLNITIEGGSQSKGNRDNSHGIKVVGNGDIDITSDTTITVTDPIGNAYGVYGKDGADIDLADTSITATSEEGTAKGIIAKDGSTVDVLGDAIITAKGLNAVGVDSNNENAISDSNGAVNLKGKVINVSADGQNAAYAIQATKGGAVNVGENSGEKVTIKATAEGSKDTHAAAGIFSRYDGSEVNVNVDTLNITANATGDAYAYGVYANTDNNTDDKFSQIDITANKTIINVSAETKTGNAIAATSQSKVFINSDLEATGDNAIYARGYGEVYVNSDENGASLGKTVVLNGDIVFGEGDTGDVIDADVVVNLDGEGSSFSGSIYTANANNERDDSLVDYVDGMNLGMSNGATWNVTGDSFVNTMNGTDGNVVLATESATNDSVDVVTVAIGTNNNAKLTVSGDDKLTEALENGEVDADTALNALKNAVTTGEGADKQSVANTVKTAEGNILGSYVLNNGKAELQESSRSAAVSEAGMNLKAHWRAHMNDMNKRMGELRMANGEAGVWTRMVRGESEYEGAKMQYNQYQLGYDEKLSVDKRWTVGAAVTFSEGDSSYSTGGSEDKSTAFAIYGTKLNNDGTFVDLIARYARLESDIEDRNYQSGEYDTNGMSVSAEFGKRIQQGNGLWIEPQVELTYGTVDSADVAFNGAKAHYDSMDSFIGRVGFSLGKDIKQGNVYARASYLYDFDGETETTFTNGTVSGKPVEEDFGGGWWEVGVGANINLSKATYIYADIEKTFGGEVDTNWQWNLGVRYSF